MNTPVQDSSISQNEQSVKPLEKTPHKKKWLFTICAIVFLLLSVFLGNYFLQSNKGRSPVPQASNELSKAPAPTTTNSKTPVYSGQTKGENILFISDSNTSGKAIWEDGRINSGFQFDQINNPQILFTLPERIDIQQFKFNSAKNKLYLRSWRENKSGQFPKLDDVITLVNLDNKEVKEAWTKQIGSKKYSNANGSAWINQIVEDKYLNLDILGCYGCEPFYGGSLIVNLDTKNEIFLGRVGNIQFNLNSGRLYYQKLSPFQESCPSYPIPNCDNGMTTVDKPAGETFTQTLP